MVKFEDGRGKWLIHDAWKKEVDFSNIIYENERDSERERWVHLMSDLLFQILNINLLFITNNYFCGGYISYDMLTIDRENHL